MIRMLKFGRVCSLRESATRLLLMYTTRKYRCLARMADEAKKYSKFDVFAIQRFSNEGTRCTSEPFSIESVCASAYRANRNYILH